VAHQGRPNIVNPAKLDYVHANDVCIQCHSQGQPLKNPIQGKYYDWPVGFRVGNNGSECIACHMPKIEQTIGDVNVRAHTFKFITPAETDSLGVPNACNSCHAERTSAWSAAALKSWMDRSPWR